MAGSSRGDMYVYGQPGIIFVPEDASKSSCTLDQQISSQIRWPVVGWKVGTDWSLFGFVGLFTPFLGTLRNLRSGGDKFPLLGSLSNGKTGPHGTFPGILETTWRTCFVTPSTDWLSRTECGLWCHKKVVKNDLGGVEGVVTGEMSGNICSHQEAITMFKDIEINSVLLNTVLLLQDIRIKKSNLDYLGFYLFFLFFGLTFLWAPENKTEQTRKEPPVAKHLWLFIVIISFLHFEKNSNSILHFWGLSIIGSADWLYHRLWSGSSVLGLVSFSCKGSIFCEAVKLFYKNLNTPSWGEADSSLCLHLWHLLMCPFWSVWSPQMVPVLTYTFPSFWF